jgi:PncC family amidohydrolase
MIGSLITDQPGSSTYFAGGVIAYSNAVKRDQLGVPESLLKSVGAVSREVAEAMADGVRRRLGTSLAVSVTGIAGPDADGTSKPVGLTFIAVASEARTSSREFRFTGDRLSNRRQAAAEALGMLIAEARLTAQTHVR